jgi:hypothetical protein
MKARHLSILLLVTAGCHHRVPPTKGCEELVGPHLHDPVADATAALKRGDARVLTLGGFSPETPGAGAQNTTKLPKRRLQGTSDVELPACLALRSAAENYARRYNQVILAQSSNGA